MVRLLGGSWVSPASTVNFIPGTARASPLVLPELGYSCKTGLRMARPVTCAMLGNAVGLGRAASPFCRKSVRAAPQLASPEPDMEPGLGQLRPGPPEAGPSRQPGRLGSLCPLLGLRTALALLGQVGTTGDEPLELQLQEKSSQVAFS